MKLFPYRKETDPDLIRAAAAAYREAPPAHNTRSTSFTRSIGSAAAPLAGPAAVIPRADESAAL